MLEAIVTLTEELAYEQAKQADELLAKGNYLGTQSFFSAFIIKELALCANML